jgi:hypothetical protein
VTAKRLELDTSINPSRIGGERIDWAMS